MSDKLNLLISEVDDETLNKLTTAVAAGLAAAAVGHHLYKKKQEKKVLEKYGGKKGNDYIKDSNPYVDSVLNAMDANAARYLTYKNNK